MIDIKRCDRCWDVYVPYRKRIKFSGKCRYYNGFTLTRDYYDYDEDCPKDLCPKCLDELIEWLNSEEK